MKQHMDYFHKYQRHQIPDYLSSWIHGNITKPITGFEHKKNYDGTPMTLQEQLEATRYQITLIATDYILRGKSEIEVMDLLMSFKK